MRDPGEPCQASDAFGACATAGCWLDELPARLALVPKIENWKGHGCNNWITYPIPSEWITLHLTGGWFPRSSRTYGEWLTWGSKFDNVVLLPGHVARLDSDHGLVPTCMVIGSAMKALEQIATPGLV